MTAVHDETLQQWIASLERRHLADLTFQEVSRALRALSYTYVERRNRTAAGASPVGALSGAGKRSAFALFYGPLHFMLVERIVAELPGACAARPLLVDLGCGTGAAGAAWAARAGIRRVLAIDHNSWALTEAARTYREFGLSAQTRKGDVARMRLPKPPASFLAAFTMNELADAAREALLRQLVDRGTASGDSVLVVEPIARTIAPWWNRWQRTFEAAGGRADEWRFRAELPPIVAKLDRASGMDHRELTGRTLWLSTQAGDRPSNN